MSETDKLKSEIADLKQYIYSTQIDKEFEDFQNLQFLKELLSNLLKWRDKRDVVSQEMAIKMIQDWIDELDLKVKNNG